MKILDVPRSGSYQGITSSHNRGGQYVRNRRTPTNSPTTRRTAIRTAFGSASSAWSGLSAANQAAWSAAADAHPITDALGQSIKLTGHQLYVSLSAALTNAGGTPSSTPPSDFSTIDLSSASATFSLATGFAGTLPGSGDGTGYVLASFSKPMSSGRNFVNLWSQYEVVSDDSTDQTVSTANYSARYGTPVAGQVVFVKYTPVNAGGVTGTAKVIRVVVTS